MTQGNAQEGCSGLAPWLNALFGAEPEGALIEVRHRRRGGMGQCFFDIRQPGIAEYVRKLAAQTDVFIGVAPRTAERGGRDAIERVHAVWADCDGAEALDALRRFRPRPAIVVRSGSPGHVHAYWPLWPPVGADEVKRANRRLAHALGADMAATDAARIMRPPGTLNHKTDPPSPVELARLEVEVFTIGEVVGELSDPPDARAPREPRGINGDDPLRTIEPAVYVAALTGRQVGRDGKVACPLHDDQEPSLHVYENAEGGWYCFGCGKGGTVYDLAREVSGIGDRGGEFRELRRWIAERLLNAPLEAA